MIRRQIQLKNLVSERTAKLVKANQRMRQEIEDRKRAEQEKASLEEQLLQSRKMEAIGQLAGGVAHDFNNLLTVINGYCELAFIESDDSNPLLTQIKEIGNAGQQAAQLTQQLLAFGRRQMLQPQIIDPKVVIRETGIMLKRLLGEHIEMAHKLNPATGKIRVDLSQLQQVLVNLAVNARDAMPEGGQLVITTQNRTLKDGCKDRSEEIHPGEYVVLIISDTGVGMDEETRSRIFEPFFTTKEIGRGTGLGLSTVFGIVKQSEGYIQVFSEPGEGTTFELLFPCVESCCVNSEVIRTVN
jgi:signal transduction histidine kinase